MNMLDAARPTTARRRVFLLESQIADLRLQIERGVELFSLCHLKSSI
jgi:hypothetical protein